MFSKALSAAKNVSASAIDSSKRAVDQTKQKLAEIDDGNTCRSCGKVLSTTLAMTNISTLHACCTCGLMCCNDCLMESPGEIPDELWAHPTLKKEAYKKKVKFCKNKCRDRLFAFWMKQFADENREKYLEALHFFLRNGAETFPTLSKPKGLEDSKLRKAMRMMVLAEYAAEAVGYDIYLKALKLFAAGGGMMGILLQNNYVAMMYPLMGLLKDFGITGPNGLLRVFYYASSIELYRKLNFDSVLEGHRAGDIGVIAEKCPMDILDYVGRYAAPAQWLYSAKLPEPHDEDDWTSWYLSRIVSKDGWSLVAVSPSASVHFGAKCPAFALVVRQHPVTNKPEAILAIRGTQSAVDWSINVDDKMVPYTYHSGQYGEKAVQGSVHKAMMEGALKILDTFAMRECIHQLVKNGYDVKIVGHSLGAATACLIACELRSGFFEKKFEDLQPVTALDGKYQEEEVPPAGGANAVPVPWIPAVGFGTPPCVDECIGDAILTDNLMVSVVHCDDIVPRLSRPNIQKLAIDVNNYAAEATKYQQEDTKTFEEYAKNYGLAGDMGDVDEEEGGQKRAEIGIETVVETTVDEPVKEMKIVEMDLPLVVPGKIVHLTFCNASYNATLCDHRLAALRSIAPLTCVVKNHEMSEHIEALRSMKLKESTVPIRDGPTWEPVMDPNSKAW
eukprot:CAMPEP_0114424922 /NCGR_PEP_ID=MMETSP0103-20121206/6954_1 /TAXON_ID=37642 ORGANISM="Paraphysomonas imperforata, Strain PA2" /NCGR_SAMPLE_ID=MMETSP0103 /ASSEMBLY_ACC=CAM_ASM_000201 /LENGTH=672 /DNA_ID=CAMNT_0001593711 /DNA_START=38 /DNA_END=2053 /DNA_ORIENTATION=+